MAGTGIQQQYNRRSGGQQKQQWLKCPLCPTNQEKPIPDGRWGCVIHQPMREISAELAKATAGTTTPWLVIVKTAENSQAKSLSFSLVSPMTGEKEHFVATDFVKGVKEVPLKEYDAIREVIISLDDEPKAECRLKVPKDKDFLPEPEVLEIEATLRKSTQALTTTGTTTGAAWWVANVVTKKNGEPTSLSFDVLDLAMQGVLETDPSFKKGFREVKLPMADEDRVVRFVLQANRAKQFELAVPKGSDWPEPPKETKVHRIKAQVVGEKDDFFLILIQTYTVEGEKLRQENVEFIVDVDGEEKRTVLKTDPDFKDGVYTAKIPMKLGSELKRLKDRQMNVRFHIVGCEADTEEIDVPELQCRKGPGADLNVGLWKNFLRGLRQ